MSGSRPTVLAGSVVARAGAPMAVPLGPLNHLVFTVAVGHWCEASSVDDVMDWLPFDRPGQHAAADQLRRTENRLLMWNNTLHATDLGPCLCGAHAATVGENLVGRALMRWRDRLNGIDTPIARRVTLVADHRRHDMPPHDEMWLRHTFQRLQNRLAESVGTGVFATAVGGSAALAWAETAASNQRSLWLYRPAFLPGWKLTATRAWESLAARCDVVVTDPSAQDKGASDRAAMMAERDGDVLVVMADGRRSGHPRMQRSRPMIVVDVANRKVAAQVGLFTGEPSPASVPVPVSRRWRRTAVA